MLIQKFVSNKRKHLFTYFISNMLLPAFKGVVTDDQPTEIAEEGQKTDGEEKPQEEKK
jgi:hypothetical protein